MLETVIAPPCLRKPMHRRLPVVLGLMGLVALLAGCATGPDTAAQDDIVPAAASAPAAVTRTPLLPPVPSAPAPISAPGSDTLATSAPPLQYDRLYSDEEQAQIRSDLLNAAARAR
jgi:hypothetical protein